MTCHDIETRLDDYVDGTLSSEERDAVEAHLAGCETCRSAAEDLRSLLTTASALPREELPRRDLWPEVRSSLESEGAGVRPAAASWRWSTLAVAALLLVALTVSVTLVIQNRLNGAMPDVAVAEIPPAEPTPAALASFRAAEKEYVAASSELMTHYERTRDQLAPETVAEVERNLDIINTAIVDARTALENDPGNRRLGQVATAMYERKVGLLRYLTRLSVPGLQG